MKRFFVALLLAFAPAPALAQAPAPAAPTAAPVPPLPDADPAMWVVRDEDTTIYLFGTFHLLDQRPWFNDEVKTAFDASDELVLEALIPENPAELQPVIMRYAVSQDGTAISERLTPEQNATLLQALGTIGVPAQAVDRIEPWYHSMILVNVAAMQLGIDGTNGPETVLSRAARERGIPVSELEGIEWQLRMFDEMPEEQQFTQLRNTIDKLDELDEALAPMLAAWSEGNVEGLVAILNEGREADADLHRIIFTDRNATWAEWVQDRLERPGTVFVAVGAGHLTGDDSVQAVLRRSGIASERVAAE